jgi:dUTP pyrophosphatase
MVDGMIGPRMSSPPPPPEVLPVRRLRADAHLPSRAHPWDAGLDLVAVEPLTLAPGARGVVATGIAVAIPEGWAGLVVPRSGLARRQGLTLTNAPGLIDAGYRGEIQVLMINLGDQPYTVRRGDRIAQMIVAPVVRAELREVDALGDSRRGPGGFGHTGVE